MRIRTKLIIKNYELEERRIKFNYTQAELASIVGINTAAYQHIESMRKKPQEEVARSLAIELETRVDILFPEGYEEILSALEPCNRERIVTNDRLVEQSDAKMLAAKIIENTNLTKRESQILDLHYGEGVEVLSAAKSLGISRSRADQLIKSATQKMRSTYEAMNDRHVGVIYTRQKVGLVEQRKVTHVLPGSGSNVRYASRVRAIGKTQWTPWNARPMKSKVTTIQKLTNWGTT